MCRRLAPCLLFMFASLAPAYAQALKEAEIRSLFTGATVAGIYADGRSFSEYHAEDGRALGDNGYAPNTDACWNTDGDKVCYHYGQKGDRKTFCFAVEKQGEDYNLRVADTGRLNAIANVTPGNPNAHGDGGKRWSCDDLLSRRGGGGEQPVSRLLKKSETTGLKSEGSRIRPSSEKKCTAAKMSFSAAC